MNKYKLIRDVTREECPWLDEDMKAGSTVESYLGCTYGCISNNGRAFMIRTGLTDSEHLPAFELPRNSVEEIK